MQLNDEYYEVAVAVLSGNPENPRKVAVARRYERAHLGDSAVPKYRFIGWILREEGRAGSGVLLQKEVIGPLIRLLGGDLEDLEKDRFLTLLVQDETGHVSSKR